MSTDNRASLDAADLTEALIHPNPKEKFAQIGETKLEALRKIANLFQYRLNKSGAPPRVEQKTPTRIEKDP